MSKKRSVVHFSKRSTDAIAAALQGISLLAFAEIALKRKVEIYLAAYDEIIAS